MSPKVHFKNQFENKSCSVDRKIHQHSDGLYLKQNKDHVDVFYYFEAEVKIICSPSYKTFPFHHHACYIAVSLY